MKFENDYPNRQTIDRKSGAYLKMERGVNHPGAYIFSFHWQGEVIEFTAVDIAENPNENKWNPNIHWKFLHLNIPPHMDDQTDKIAVMIKQALEAHGRHYTKDGYESVIAEYKQ